MGVSSEAAAPGERQFRVVVFDLGGVVLGSPLEGIAEFEREHGLPPGFVNVAIVSRGKGGAFQRLERGELGLGEFYREFRRELAEPSNVVAYRAWLAKHGRAAPAGLAASVDVDTVALFASMMAKAASINPDMLHALFVLRGLGLGVCALTNNWQLAEEQAPGVGSAKDSSSTNLLQGFFDEIIESSVVGLRKPDPRLYELTVSRLGVTHREVVFLDDIGMNLSAASKLGWHTVKVEIGRAREALSQLADALGVSRATLVPPAPSAVPATLRFAAGAQGGALALDVYGLAFNPAVVLLHGGGQTRHSWAKTAQQLAEHGFFALAVDMKGHGDSYWDTRPGVPRHERYMSGAFAEDLDRLVDALRLPRRASGFALVGASLGGLAILGSRAAKQARAVVLVDVTPRLAHAGVTRIVSFMKKHADFATLEDAAKAIQQYNPKSGSSASAELNANASANTSASAGVNAKANARDDASASASTAQAQSGLHKNLRRTPEGRWRWHWDPEFLSDRQPTPQELEMFEEHVMAHARGMVTPCLLVRGRQTDLVSEDAAKAFVAAMPDARYVDVADAAHMVVGDRNDVFAAETIRFLTPLLPPVRDPRIAAPAPDTAKL
jgi:epoxide hydrolase-like predicted phosphatase